MAIFRKIHVSFWADPYVSTLSDKEKLFYLYLLTNERTTQLGAYEITKKQMAFDTGYSIDMVSILLKKLIIDDKIKYNEKTFEVGIKNWNKYNLNPSKKVQVLVDKEIKKIKDSSLIEYVYSINTVSIHNPQEEEEEEIEEERLMSEVLNENNDEVITYSIKLLNGFKKGYPDNRDLDFVTVKEWVKPIRELIKKKKYTQEEISGIAQFSFEHEFWHGKIMNTRSLYLKFEELKEEYKKKKKKRLIV